MKNGQVSGNILFRRSHWWPFGKNEMWKQDCRLLQLVFMHFLWAWTNFVLYNYLLESSTGFGIIRALSQKSVLIASFKKGYLGKPNLSDYALGTAFEALCSSMKLISKSVVDCLHFMSYFFLNIPSCVSA